jgi:ankyrin repeat protein
MLSLNVFRRLALVLFIILVSSCSQDKDKALIEAVGNGDIGEVKALLAKGVDVNGSTKKKKPVHYAAANYELLQVLIKSGMELNDVSPFYGTILTRHARVEDTRILELLLKSGADANGQRPSSQATALIEVSSKDRPESISILLKHGADINLKFDTSL